MLTFITPIAYDFKYAFDTIRSYYAIADEIILGLDKDRISWSGHPYPFDDDTFNLFIRDLDKEQKIRVIEDDFHSHDHPLTNDHEERKTLASHAQKGHWIIQIDSDEILLNPREFADWIREAPSDHGIKAQWIQIYKRVGDDFLAIKDPEAYITIATQYPDKLVMGRESDQPSLRSPLRLLHLAYGRTRDELITKVSNWSHSREVHLPRLIHDWDMATLETYHLFRDFHPLYPPWWPALEHIKIPKTSDHALHGGPSQAPSST